VKIHSSTLVVPLVVVLLVIGAGAVLATSGPSAPVNAPAPAAATPSPDATTAPASGDPGKGPAAAPFLRPFADDTALKTALDKLVAAGTITADQEQAILDAVKAERQARLQDLQAQRQALQAQRDQIRQFLADGVITQDELNQLPADSPLRKLSSLMTDGKITVDELRQLGQDLFPGFGRGFGRGRGFGFFGPHKGGPQPNASASPIPSTGG
jgi:polyhydroxyalkanoate synthesis regulator phasin